MATTGVDEQGDAHMEGTSPKTKTTMETTIERSLDAMETDIDARADPDAQTTVTDFLDFTEYLPSDMVRSLTLIGKLDGAYSTASTRVNELTTTWGHLPALAPEERPVPAKLRADISEQLNQAVSSRVFAHTEAVRMSENVHRHYNKAKLLLSKLQTMMDNYPTEEQKSPVTSRSPQMMRSKVTVRPGGEGGQKVRHKRVPKITVPGEVLAPYDIEYDTFSDDSDVSSDEESEPPAAVRRTPGNIPRIKLVTHKPKSANRAPRPITITDAALAAAAAANAAALLNPPPENAVIGSADAPWLQLTLYELAKLRKRMKKNATWTPSETMIARELKALDRGPDAYREAKKAAEDEGKVFDPKIPAPVVDDESGAQQLPAGAISVDSSAHDSNRGMKLNEAKKLKREAMAKLAAEEAEELERKTKEGNKDFRFLAPPAAATAAALPKGEKPRAKSSSSHKRKRSSEGEAVADAGEEIETPSRPQLKRNKTETPVPPPQRPGSTAAPSEPSQLASQRTPSVASITPSQTPVPIPIPPMRGATSPSPGSAASNTVTTSVPVKAPAQTPVPLPPTVASMGSSVTDTPSSGSTRRQTRGEAAKQIQQYSDPPTAADLPIRRSSSRGATPHTTPAPERRPGSRAGKAMSQEPQSNHAADRPRRASTARNTPAPEAKPPAKRSKRPAPGIVSTTSSGGNSAVGKRKAAPRKKARTTKKDKDQPAETEMEDVDDEGNPIDPDEPRYCTCNRVSFGTMIQCDNVDGCKHEWFHLECVGLSSIPARTTKWYCPDCRVLLGLGVKGEVSARGVKK